MNRCRYSRRLYLLKSQFHNPDYIDDSDLTFLENLITFHIDYVNNSCKPIDIRSSILPEKYQSLFNKICSNFSLINDSTMKTELYKKFDLEYRGEERHVRNIKEQIITYLQQKKGNIFTNRRVEFFLKLVTTTKHDELRKLCKEMLFSMKSPRRSNLGKRNKDFNINKRTSVSEDNMLSLIPYEQRETLLLPYLRMIHPPSILDHDKVRKLIADCVVDTVPDVTSKTYVEPFCKNLTSHLPFINHKVPSNSLSPKTINGGNRHSVVVSKTAHSHFKLPNKTKFVKNLNYMLTKPSSLRDSTQSSAMHLRQRKRHSEPSKHTKSSSDKRNDMLPNSSDSKPFLAKIIKMPKEQNTDIKKSRQNHSTETSQPNNDKDPQLKAVSPEVVKTLPTHTSKNLHKEVDYNAVSNDIGRELRPRQCRSQNILHTPPALIDRLGQSIKDTKKSPYTKASDEVIEISDDEVDMNEDLKLSVAPDSQDIDRTIDYLTHHCSIRPSTHPTLLKDHQMRIELNGFLLLVNIAIRYSLRSQMTSKDKKLFDCIFISSVVFGLNCAVFVNTNGINIDRLSAEDYHIAVSRLSSMQVSPIKQTVTNDRGLRSILINPDIGRLTDLTMFYVQSYHATGRLVTAAEVVDHRKAV